jgi:hypothetical protein
MATVLLYTYFAASVALALIGAASLVRLSRGVAVPGANGIPMPKWLHVFLLCFGCFGMLSSAASIFGDDPHWFVDKIYFVVSKIIAAFA